MIEKNEKVTLADSLGTAIEKSKKSVIVVSVLVVVAIVAVAVCATLRAKSAEKGIEQIDLISYELTSDADGLSETDVAARQATALDALAPLSGKSGVVGLRANMLLAEIKFAQKNYSEARDAWLKAVAAKNKAYTASLCYYNAAVCSENLNDIENAISYYKQATSDEDFLLIDHALYSLGRVNESAAKYDDAKSAYDTLYALHPSSQWAQLAKSRLIALNIAGNIQ